MLSWPRRLVVFGCELALDGLLSLMIWLASAAPVELGGELARPGHERGACGECSACRAFDEAYVLVDLGPVGYVMGRN